MVCSDDSYPWTFMSLRFRLSLKLAKKELFFSSFFCHPQICSSCGLSLLITWNGKHWGCSHQNGKSHRNTQSPHLISQLVLLFLTKPNYILFGWCLSSSSTLPQYFKPSSSLAHLMYTASHLNSLFHIYHFTSHVLQHSSQNYGFKMEIRVLLLCLNLHFK